MMPLKKQSTARYLADLQEIRKAYVQDVKEQYSIDNRISQENSFVNTTLSKNDKNDTTIKRSVSREKAIGGLQKGLDENSGDVVEYRQDNSTESGDRNGSEYSEALAGEGASQNNDSVWQRSDDSEGTYTILGDGKESVRVGKEEGRGLVDWGRELQLYDINSPREKELAYGFLRKISKRKIKNFDSNVNGTVLLTHRPQKKMEF